MFSRTPRFLFLLLAAFFLLSPVQSQAGVFKNLFDRIGKTVEDYNRDMWTGENSLGNTVLHGKGGFNKRFEAVAQAMGRAQDNAKANVKAVWESLKDIALWLPRKLGAAFKKLMDKVRAFGDRLADINSATTVKERWRKLTGGGAPGAPSSMNSLPRASQEAPAPSSQDILTGPLSGLRDLLTETPTPDASLAAPASQSKDFTNLLARLNKQRPEGAPGAPSSSVDPSVFGDIFQLTTAIKDQPHQKEARKRVRLAYVTTLDEALGSARVQVAADLIRSSSDLYQGDPGPMVRAMSVLAHRHPKYAKSLTQSARRMENMSRRASQSPR
jgi:hypothetical protein